MIFVLNMWEPELEEIFLFWITCLHRMSERQFVDLYLHYYGGRFVTRISSAEIALWYVELMGGIKEVSGGLEKNDL